MMLALPCAPFLRYLLLLALCFHAAVAQAMPIELHGKWYVPRSTHLQNTGPYNPDTAGFARVKQVALTGGHFLYAADFCVGAGNRHVLDFKNTSIVAHFRHRIYDEQQQLVFAARGGIESAETNPFFLRHGRELSLPVGCYRLVTEMESPFFLATPEPYLDTLADYRQAIKPANALALTGLGVFMGLGVYYAALALARRRLTEGMYALFILGNFLFNGAALLVFSDLFGLREIYLTGLPILFSNIAYVIFVMALLEIRRRTHPRLAMAGRAILATLLLFVLIAAFKPHWSLELERYGVGLFLTYGLVSGIFRSWQGNIPARLYLVAITLFFVFGAIAITQAQLSGIYTVYLEHVGLIAVAVEVILLALVLAYQFAQLHHEKEHALEKMERSNRIAHTDALTGLPNRYALDIELEHLPQHASLTFIDLDGLKYYNDTFGHARGDELLRSFSHHMLAHLDGQGRLYRIGGDEFAMTCPNGDHGLVQSTLNAAISHMHAAGFEFTGASAGSAHLHEAANKNELKHMADTRMYQNKRQRKQQASFDTGTIA